MEPRATLWNPGMHRFAMVGLGPMGIVFSRNAFVFFNFFSIGDGAAMLDIIEFQPSVPRQTVFPQFSCYLRYSCSPPPHI
jgi:hypothetical protein